MPGFEDDDYRWRETYFILFKSAKRPLLEKVRRAIQGLGRMYELRDPQTDERGRFDSITVLSASDRSALEISYEEGAGVKELVDLVIKDLKSTGEGEVSRDQLKAILQCDARLEVMHFEQVLAGMENDEDDVDTAFDPSALLTVMEALLQLTEGIGIDPQSGSLL
jgi:hypothetical protein